MLTGDAIRLGIHPSCRKEASDIKDKEVDSYLDDLKMAELRKLARQQGISTPFGITKRELITKLKGD